MVVDASVLVGIKDRELERQDASDLQLCSIKAALPGRPVVLELEQTHRLRDLVSLVFGQAVKLVP